MCFQEQFVTYIVECADKSLYIGKTKKLHRRLLEHNGILPNGARYTRMRRPVILRYFETHIDNTSAMKREFALKRMSKDQKIKLIHASTVLKKIDSE